METSKVSKLNRPIIITVSAVFLLVLLLSYFCPLITDDLHFKFIWNGFDAKAGSEVRVSSIADIIESAKNYYQYSGGRVVCHTIVFAMVNLPKWVFAIFNAAMFCIAGLLIHGHILKKTRKKSDLTLAFIYLSMFFLLPVWGDSILWMSGSVNYLWSGTAILWAIYLIDREDNSKKNLYLSCIAVLIASSTNEIAGGVLSIILILRMIFWKKKPFSYFYMVLFCVIPGIGLVLSAPGNKNRMKLVDGHASIGLTDVLKTAYGYLGSYFSWASLILFVIFAVLFYMIFKKSKVSELINPMTVTIACTLGACALGFSGVVIQRALFTVIFPLLIPFWSLSSYFLYTMDKPHKSKAVIASLGLLAILCLATQEFMVGALLALFTVLYLLINILAKGRLGTKQTRSKKRDIIFISILSAIVIFYSVMFFFDVSKYDSYIEQTVAAMKEGDGEKVSELRPNKQLSSSFFPVEGTIVSDYSVSWIYEYYVVNGGK